MHPNLTKLALTDIACADYALLFCFHSRGQHSSCDHLLHAIQLNLHMHTVVENPRPAHTSAQLTSSAGISAGFVLPTAACVSGCGSLWDKSDSRPCNGLTDSTTLPKKTLCEGFPRCYLRTTFAVRFGVLRTVVPTGRKPTLPPRRIDL